MQEPRALGKFPSVQELVEQLDRAFQERDLLEFDETNPAHWRVALGQQLDVELDFHIPDSDRRVVNAILLLMREADRKTPAEWSAMVQTLRGGVEVAQDAVVVDEVTVEPDIRRCDPDNPQPGCIDFEDPTDAPSHGTQSRYNSPRFQCRCSWCSKANTDYRRERRQARRKEQEDDQSDCDRRSSGVR
jgi:hypothetical protein